MCPIKQHNDDANARVVVVPSFYGTRAEPIWFCIVRTTRECPYVVRTARERSYDAKRLQGDADDCIVDI